MVLLNEKFCYFFNSEHFCIKQSRQAEKEAITEGVKENGLEDSDKVIRAVLGQRHAKEMTELERQMAAERKIMLDNSFQEVTGKYERMRQELARKHEAQLQALQGEDLSPEEHHLRRSNLLNKHQLEMADLDRQQNKEQIQREQSTTTDWEVSV